MTAGDTVSRIHLRTRSDEFQRWAMDALRTHRFANQRDRNIWSWHAAGKSARTIAAHFGYSRWRVADRVTELHAEIRKAQQRRADEPADVPHLIEECDPVFLLQLAVALETPIDG